MNAEETLEVHDLYSLSWKIADLSILMILWRGSGRDTFVSLATVLDRLTQPGWSDGGEFKGDGGVPRENIELIIQVCSYELSLSAANFSKLHVASQARVSEPKTEVHSVQGPGDRAHIMSY
jgi:hypothetical protein